MGLFSFVGDIVSSTVKIALTPVAILKDGVDVISGVDPENTKDLLESAGEDLSNSIDDLMK